MKFQHTSVMLTECLKGLAICPEGVYLDGTAGGGGHSAAIAQRLTTGRLIALDQDPDAVQAARLRLQGLPAQVVQSNFRDVNDVLRTLGIDRLDGALLDLGVSSHQLDEGTRGFSYLQDALLDMRMSREGKTAAQLLAELDRQELAQILREYGEEPYAWQIAGRIVRERERNAIATTGQLAQLVCSAVPPAVRRRDKHPARRTFQALRIAVNGEMQALGEGLQALFELLRPGGRLCVITFHSLEDRMVKQHFRRWAQPCSCPPELPVCVCGGVAKAIQICKKPVEASAQECAVNRRARSARLRVLEKQ